MPLRLLNPLLAPPLITLLVFVAENIHENNKGGKLFTTIPDDINVIVGNIQTTGQNRTFRAKNN